MARAACSHYLPPCSPSSGRARQRTVVLTIPANEHRGGGASRKPTFLTIPGACCPEPRSKALSLLTTVLDWSVPKRYASDGFREQGRGMRVGYARVSTTDESPELQLDALRRAGCGEMSTEKASGAKADRPELARVLDDVLREGDVLVVWKLDRLARSLKKLITTAEDLGGTRDRVGVADREHRHHYAGGRARVPCVRSDRAIRARTNPRTHHRRPRRGTPPRTRDGRRRSRKATSPRRAR